MRNKNKRLSQLRSSTMTTCKLPYNLIVKRLEHLLQPALKIQYILG